MKNKLYSLGLTAMITFSGCNEEPGFYNGVIDGWNAVYDTRRSYECILTMEKEGKSLIITDSGCDNLTDYAETLKGGNRENFYSDSVLEQSGRMEKLNSLLREGQKLVKPENRDLKREEQIRQRFQGYGKEAQEELDDLLQP